MQIEPTVLLSFISGIWLPRFEGDTPTDQFTPLVEIFEGGGSSVMTHTLPEQKKKLTPLILEQLPIQFKQAVARFTFSKDTWKEDVANFAASFPAYEIKNYNPLQ